LEALDKVKEINAVLEMVPQAGAQNFLKKNPVVFFL
jgi:hypothetical protein